MRFRLAAVITALVIATAVTAAPQRRGPAAAPALPPLSMTCVHHPDVLESKAGVCPYCKLPLVPVRLDSAWMCPVHTTVIESECRELPPVPPPARAGDRVAHLDVRGGSRRRASRAWHVRGRFGARRAQNAARTRQSQPAAWRSVLHGAGQLASPRGRASLGSPVQALRLRRLRPSALRRQGESADCACRHEGGLRSGDAKDDRAERVPDEARTQPTVSGGPHRTGGAAGRDDGESEVRQRSTGVSLRLHLRSALEGACCSGRPASWRTIAVVSRGAAATPFSDASDLRTLGPSDLRTPGPSDPPDSTRSRRHRFR